VDEPQDTPSAETDRVINVRQTALAAQPPKTHTTAQPQMTQSTAIELPRAMPRIQPVQQQNIQPIQQSVYQPAQQPVYQPAQPIQQQVQQSVYQPAQQSVYQQVQQSVYQQVQPTIPQPLKPQLTAVYVEAPKAPQTLAGHMLVDPDYYAFMPRGSHIAYVVKGETETARAYVRSVVTNAHGEHCLLLAISPNSKSANEIYMMPFNSIEKLWKKYNDECFIELQTIYNSLYEMRRIITEQQREIQRLKRGGA
jgi:hypothetical protein